MQVFVRKPDSQLLEWLEERRRNGVDGKDEVWDGVLHVVPPASLQHQTVGSELLIALHPLARRSGLQALYEVGVFDRVGRETNYRTPDLVVADPRYLSSRGVEARAEIVIEILSPDDETRNKLAFYAGCGIPELWIVHPITRATDVYVLHGGVYLEQTVALDGVIEAPRLGLALRLLPGPKLQLAWQDGTVEI